MKYNFYRNSLRRIFRRIAIGTISGYRTIPYLPALAIASQIPIELLIEERAKLETTRDADKIKTREDIELKWEEMWRNEDHWTKAFIPSVNEWRKKAGDVDFYVTQGITGHGVFITYLHRIGKSADELCWYCGTVDSPEHTVFVCDHFNQIRWLTNGLCRVSINKNNVGQLLLEKKENWTAITKMIRFIM